MGRGRSPGPGLGPDPGLAAALPEEAGTVRSPERRIAPGPAPGPGLAPGLPGDLAPGLKEELRSMKHQPSQATDHYSTDIGIENHLKLRIGIKYPINNTTLSPVGFFVKHSL